MGVGGRPRRRAQEASPGKAWPCTCHRADVLLTRPCSLPSGRQSPASARDPFGAHTGSLASPAPAQGSLGAGYAGVPAGISVAFGAALTTT